MSIRAGTLSDSILFQSRLISGEGAQRMITWPDAFTVWAEPQRNSETTCRFIIRYRSGIAPDTHRIIWDGCIWNITSAIHDLRRTTLTIDCDFSEAVNTTDLDSEHQEFISTFPVLRPRDDE